MNRIDISDTQLNLLLQAIERFDEIDSVIVFGSRAMGNHKKGSDVDLAIKGAGINDNTVLKLSTLLNEELPLPQFFDVVHYDTLDNASLLQHIDTEGVTLTPAHHP